MNLSSGKRRALAAVLVFLVLFGLFGFFVLPPIIRTQAEKRLSVELGRAVSIGGVRVNPFALSLTLEGVDIREREGGSGFLSWSRLYVRFDALASLAGDWVLGAVELDGFHGSVVVNPDGSLNFSDLLAKASAAPAKPGRPIRVGRLQVSGARVDFIDRSLKRPFATQLGPLTFALTGFRTVGSSGAPYHFEAMTDAGEHLVWDGTLSADPLQSQGEFEVENIVLAKYAPYFERLTRADVDDGKLTARGRYDADFDPNMRALTLSDAELHLSALKVVERSSGKTAVALNALDVTGVQADALAMKASIARVAVSGAHLAIRREKDGSINLLSLLRPAEGTPAAAAVHPATPSVPEVLVGEIAVKDSVVEITDAAMPHEAQFSMGGLQLSVKNFTLADGATMPVRLTFDWAPGGTVEVDGSFALKPALRADVGLNVVALDVLPLSPYLEQRVSARITGGLVSTVSSLRASLSGGKLTGSLEGALSVDKLGLVDAARNEDLAGLSHLALTGLKVETGPIIAVSIDHVAVGGPYARVRVNADKSLNVSSLLAPPSQPPAGAPPGAPSAPPHVEIGSVAVSGGEFSFSDASVEPNVHVSLVGFGGTISGLSSENMARADVALKGSVDGTGPVEITGKLDPLGAHKFVGLKINVTNVDLLFTSPYMGKFAGYQLARGQLVVDSKILVDGDAVDATNVVTMKQFTFGLPTSSPDATGLPVRLGVALLKDTEGKIVIDLPVQGSLADPKFRIGKVVIRVIVNLLTKAAVSPFSLVGSMFGGGGDELAFQDFDPGSSDLRASELPKLGVLTKALSNRPALNLGIEGSYDPAADTYALKRIKLALTVRRKIWEERHAVSPNIAPPDELVISAEDNAAMIRKLFDAKFPAGTPIGPPPPAPPPAAAPPPEPRSGLFQRIVDLMTSRSARDQPVAAEAGTPVTLQRPPVGVEPAAPVLSLDQMTGRLADTMEVTRDDLAALAAERARHVRNHLIDSGHISADRLFLSQTSDPAQQNKGPRVFLTLE